MFRVTAFVVKFVKNSFRKVKGEAVFKSHDSQLFCSEQEITLKFNLDGTLWWGGFRERLVGMVKNCLKKLIGSERLSFTVLSTFLFEIETVFNNRPMFFMCDGDLPRYLRQTVYWKVVESFWMMWHREYLDGLREIRSYRKVGKWASEIRVSDVVVKEEDAMPRNRWRLGVVVDLLEGSDGYVRGAKVKVGKTKKYYSASS